MVTVNTSHRICTVALLGCTGLWCGNVAWANGSSTAIERTVWGEVTRVEPITSAINIRPDPDCAGPRPVGASLADLLAWDLHPECRNQQHQKIEGYQVSYTWDGRSYTTQMPTRPGPRIPLRLRIR